MGRKEVKLKGLGNGRRGTGMGKGGTGAKEDRQPRRTARRVRGDERKGSGRKY